MTTENVNNRLESIAPGVYRFDTGYIRPRHTACFIIAAQDRVAIVDCGVAATIQPLLAALDSLAITTERVDAVIATHAHLDHAGGVGQLMMALPSARLYAHPSAARHLIDPTKLEKGVRAVYGDAFFDREYGRLEPVAADRVVETPDNAEVPIGERVLDIFHTPGHARHHQSIFDRRTATLLAGDAFGVGYPELDSPAGRFFVPETPPNQFDPDAMHASIDRIIGLAPQRVAPTHFGNVDEVATIGQQLHTFVDQYIDCCRHAQSMDDLEEAIMALYVRALTDRGRADDVPRMRTCYGLDVQLVAQGLWDWRSKQSASA
ncbi:MBL fold metallo-hydrolase [Salinisphaera sp. USBA-960]|nr:MBL fold metallo-hydrolase [Salifodinibacter halophilus]NNC26341.1 MBL fold metallo-hydrolase [Salifodinibacter halophilus]